MNKHAYLIMMHNEIYIFEKLLLLLDDYRNDIYIHVDKKLNDFDFEYYKKFLNKSRVFFIKRTDVRWGTIGQIKCELLLLSNAVKQNYSYYHLISGVDLPLKSIDDIYNSFENSKKEFIEYDDFDFIKNDDLNRVKYFHLFGHFWRNNNNFLEKIFRKARALVVKLQTKLKIDRVNNSKLDFRKGPNWFSITNECAKYILSQKNILKYFRFSYCADELFIQTIVYNSKFKNNLYKNKNDKTDCKRYVDWEKGSPAVLKSEDYDIIINSEDLFGRKFSVKTDQVVIDKIYNSLK